MFVRKFVQIKIVSSLIKTTVHWQEFVYLTTGKHLTVSRHFNFTFSPNITILRLKCKSDDERKRKEEGKQNKHIFISLRRLFRETITSNRSPIRTSNIIDLKWSKLYLNIILQKEKNQSAPSRPRTIGCTNSFQSFKCYNLIELCED